MSCYIMHFEGQSLVWQGPSPSKNSHAILRQALLCPEKDKDELFTLEDKHRTLVRGGDPFLGTNGEQSVIDDRRVRKKLLSSDNSVFDIAGSVVAHSSKFKPNSPGEKILFDSAADLIQDDIHTEMEVAAHLPSDSSEYTANLLSQLSSSPLLPTMTSSQVSSVLSALEPNTLTQLPTTIFPPSTNTQSKCPPNITSTSIEHQIQTDFNNKTLNNTNLTIIQELQPTTSVLPTDVIKQEKTKKKRTFCLTTKAIIRYYTENRIKGNVWYQCSSCPFISVHRNTIIQHCIISHDTGSTINGKNGGLNNLHMYKCLACNNLFYNTHSLKIHYIFDHSTTNEEIDDLLKLTIEINKYLKTTTALGNVPLNLKPDTPAASSVKDNIQQLVQQHPQQANCDNLEQVPDGQTPVDVINRTNNSAALFPLFFDEQQTSNSSISTAASVVPAPTLSSSATAHCQTTTKPVELQHHHQPSTTITQLPTVPPSSTITASNANNTTELSVPVENIQTALTEQQQYSISSKNKDPALKKFRDLKLKKGGGKKCGLGGCALRFGAISNLEYHKKCHHRTKWKCPECHKSCTSWNTVSSHLWREHGIDIELYSCDHCSYKTNSLTRLLNLHRRIHSEERPFLCDVCGKGFKTTKQLRNHKSWHKLKEKNKSEIAEKLVSCLTCGRGFTCARLMRLHVQVVHKRLKPYLCYVCGHSAANKSSLRLHQSMHTGLRPYSCNECDYTTRDHNNLRRHKMRHSGIKRYKCPLCSYSSIQASTYKTHILKKHPGQQDGLLYRCELCPFNTVKKENLLTHSARHEVIKNPDVNVT